MPKESKHTEASFSPISTDSLCLRVAQIPRSRDVAIFVPTTDDRWQTKPIALPLAHARGVMRMHVVTTRYCHVVLAIVTHFKWLRAWTQLKHSGSCSKLHLAVGTLNYFFFTCYNYVDVYKYHCLKLNPCTSAEGITVSELPWHAHKINMTLIYKSNQQHKFMAQHIIRKGMHIWAVLTKVVCGSKGKCLGFLPLSRIIVPPAPWMLQCDDHSLWIWVPA